MSKTSAPAFGSDIMGIKGRQWNIKVVKNMSLLMTILYKYLRKYGLKNLMARYNGLFDIT